MDIEDAISFPKLKNRVKEFLHKELPATYTLKAFREKLLIFVFDNVDDMHRNLTSIEDLTPFERVEFALKNLRVITNFIKLKKIDINYVLQQNLILKLHNILILILDIYEENYPFLSSDARRRINPNALMIIYSLVKKNV